MKYEVQKIHQILDFLEMMTMYEQFDQYHLNYRFLQEVSQNAFIVN